jgi:hypothetical protein
MTARQTKSLDKVGYGNPPRHTQFRKGRSGNPRGRPPRDPVRRLKALTLQEAYRLTAMKENGRMVPITSMEAILRSQVELAAKGNIQAQRAILAAVRQFEEEHELAAIPAVNCRGICGPETGGGSCEHEPDTGDWDEQEASKQSEVTKAGGE